MVTAMNARRHLSENENETSRLLATEKTGAPIVEAREDSGIATAKAALAATDARIADMRSGALRPTDLFSASYPADMKII
jgi:hypothetical protein